MTDLDAESRRILELAGVARTPSAEDKARVERRLAVALGLSASAASGTAATAAHAANGATAAKSVASAAAMKWWVGGVLVVGAVASYVGFSTPATPAQRAPHVATNSAAAPAAPAAATPAVEPRQPAIEPSTTDETAALPGLDADTRPVAGQPVAAPRSARRVEHRRPATPDDSLAAELELLHRAQAAWRARQAQSALSLLDQHRARYPHSQLELERDALQVLTLCELGKKDQAARIAHSVLSRAPRSPLRASLEQSCAFK